MLIGIIVLVVIVGIIILGYNGLVRSRNLVQEAESQITVQLKRRMDLIPNLVETVKGYAKHESETLAKVTAARSRITNEHTGLTEKLAANDQLTGMLGHLFAVSESYPDLKANQNFIQLQEELTNTENKVAFSRQNYNGNVQVYNTKLQSFPGNVFAKLFRFKAADFLAVPEEDKQAPKVQF